MHPTGRTDKRLWEIGVVIGNIIRGYDQYLSDEQRYMELTSPEISCEKYIFARSSVTPTSGATKPYNMRSRVETTINVCSLACPDG